jgi:hypothetical protein
MQILLVAEPSVSAETSMARLQILDVKPHANRTAIRSLAQNTAENATVTINSGMAEAQRQMERWDATCSATETRPTRAVDPIVYHCTSTTQGRIHPPQRQ